MGLGGSPNDFGFMIILLLGGMFVLAVLFGLSGLVARIIGRLTGISAGWPATLLGLGLAISLVLAGWLYMDVLALSTTGVVTGKDESIDVEPDGGWRHQFQLQLQYPFEGQASVVGLSVGEERYDSLRLGEAADLRVVPLWHSVSIVRLADLHTGRLVAWAAPWLLLGGLVLAGFWLITRVKSRLGCALLAGPIIVVAAAVPVFLTYRAWQAAEDLGRRPERAEATVVSVRRITNIDYLPCESGDCGSAEDTSFDVPQQFDIVQLRYRPEGLAEVVLAVDTADADPADAGPFAAAEGRAVTIAYDPARPRDVQILGAEHSHHWRNAVHFGWLYVLGWLAFIAALVVIIWVARGGFRRLAAAATKKTS
jgi:hypothetical protein